jgi:tagaturonate reductase
MLPHLNKALSLRADFQARTDIRVPKKALFELPEKVLQFGSGVLLRGFVDYFIDNANHQGVFNGRVIVVQSTAKGKSDALNEQDRLYTLCEQGLENSVAVERYSVLSSISRAISAADQWQAVLQCASIPTLELIISNTTEVGLSYDEKDSALHQPPKSFPAKLARLLFERFRLFPEKGFVIIPTELIENNGDKLRDYVFKHAAKAHFGKEFEQWLLEKNRFCNSLVDRIVPGMPEKTRLQEIEQQLGYCDDLFICSELYSLWAIEGDERVANVCSFQSANPSVMITKNITPYRERKLRILNGTHTISVGIALLCGKETVLEMMNDPLTSTFVETVVSQEIIPSLDIDHTKEFAADVLNRFRNPFLRHKLYDITFQYTSKFKTRVLPIIRKYYEKHSSLPKRILFGFAAYLWFSRGVEMVGSTIYGEIDTGKFRRRYLLQDDFAPNLYQYWRYTNPYNFSEVIRFVKNVAADQDLWGMNLDGFTNFSSMVSRYLNAIIQRGVLDAMHELDK